MAVRKTKAGLALKRWFKEDWKDQRTGKACGRKKGEKRGTPYCRPSKRISSKTPKTGSEMSASEKRKRISQKKRLGQPAGKPRRVEAARRKKKK
tara:strand:- start:55 stop:336 length:282 start_codon:yes stop_codon:yes gene_type:complete